jgi:nitrate/TMAO reductase-like tetraheme cytochrome c subunit
LRRCRHDCFWYIASFPCVAEFDRYRHSGRFEANDSLECRNCHSAASMDITKQSPRASVAHQRFLFPGEKTCIDCHKGIAHHLPDMRSIPGWQ